MSFGHMFTLAVEVEAMRILFRFNLEKAIQAMMYIVERLGSVDKAKLAKLLYIADRDHFVSRGHPITGDRQYALKWGPVPSLCLDALNGQSWPDPQAPFKYIHIDDNKVTLRAKSQYDRLDDEEKETLDRVLREYGTKETWGLVSDTHRFPEYAEVYVEGTSTPIPYEVILRHYGGEVGYRHNRAVISESTLAHMNNPFRTGSETDL